MIGTTSSRSLCNIAIVKMTHAQAVNAKHITTRTASCLAIVGKAQKLAASAQTARVIPRVPMRCFSARVAQWLMGMRKHSASTQKPTRAFRRRVARTGHPRHARKTSLGFAATLIWMTACVKSDRPVPRMAVPCSCHPSLLQTGMPPLSVLSRTWMQPALPNSVQTASMTSRTAMSSNGAPASIV